MNSILYRVIDQIQNRITSLESKLAEKPAGSMSAGQYKLRIAENRACLKIIKKELENPS